MNKKFTMSVWTQTSRPIHLFRNCLYIDSINYSDRGVYDKVVGDIEIQNQKLNIQNIGIYQVKV